MSPPKDTRVCDAEATATEVRHFGEAEYAEARDWIRSEEPGSASGFDFEEAEYAEPWDWALSLRPNTRQPKVGVGS
jgi:hypothetical protein